MICLGSWEIKFVPYMIWHLMCHSSIGAVNYFVNDNIENQLLQIIWDVKFISQFCVYIIN